MKKIVALLLIVLIVLVCGAIMIGKFQDTYYDGMMSYCLYVPYYYVDGQPVYQEEPECREVVDDAREKGLYYNPRQITGPGFDLPQNTVPGVDG